MYTVVIGVSSLAPITVVAACLLQFRDWIYARARRDMGR